MPDKHEVGGSSPLGPTTASCRSRKGKATPKNTNKISVKVSLVTFLFKESNMLIENRIKYMKRNR